MSSNADNEPSKLERAFDYVNSKIGPPGEEGIPDQSIETTEQASNVSENVHESIGNATMSTQESLEDGRKNVESKAEAAKEKGREIKESAKDEADAVKDAKDQVKDDSLGYVQEKIEQARSN